jgi:hypothetical protein
MTSSSSRPPFKKRNSIVTFTIESHTIKKPLKLVGLVLILFLCCLNANASNVAIEKTDQSRVITTLKNTENFIKKYGIKKAFIKFKNSNNIFIGNYNGQYFVSPLHPELIGKNQYDYKDAYGALVVQEEINQAKAGGGWLKGRLRKNALTGKYQCRKIYILPVAENYFIGSWYHYSPRRESDCNNAASSA